MKPFFTRHALDRLLERFGTVLTPEEVSAILASVEVPEERGMLELDVFLSSRN